MATDKRLDQVSTLTDFDFALIVKGDQVAKASKRQLAELVGNLLYGATSASSLATVVAEQSIGLTRLKNGENSKPSLLFSIPLAKLYGSIMFEVFYSWGDYRSIVKGLLGGNRVSAWLDQYTLGVSSNLYYTNIDNTIYVYIKFPDNSYGTLVGALSIPSICVSGEIQFSDISRLGAPVDALPDGVIPATALQYPGSV